MRSNRRRTLARLHTSRRLCLSTAHFARSGTFNTHAPGGPPGSIQAFFCASLFVEEPALARASLLLEVRSRNPFRTAIDELAARRGGMVAPLHKIRVDRTGRGGNGRLGTRRSCGTVARSCIGLYGCIGPHGHVVRASHKQQEGHSDCQTQHGADVSVLTRARQLPRGAPICHVVDALRFVAAGAIGFHQLLLFARRDGVIVTQFHRVRPLAARERLETGLILRHFGQWHERAYGCALAR